MNSRLGEANRTLSSKGTTTTSSSIANLCTLKIIISSNSWYVIRSYVVTKILENVAPGRMASYEIHKNYW